MNLRRHKHILQSIAAEKRVGFMVKRNARGKRIVVLWSFRRPKPLAVRGHPRWMGFDESTNLTPFVSAALERARMLMVYDRAAVL